MDYVVVIEAAWLVRDVATVDDAIGVAISEAGKRLNQEGLEYVDINVGVTCCPACDEPFDSAYLAANTAIVGLILEMQVFNVESPEHARRIAKGEIGRVLTNVPLSIIDTIQSSDADGASST